MTVIVLCFIQSTGQSPSRPYSLPDRTVRPNETANFLPYLFEAPEPLEALGRRPCLVTGLIVALH